MKLHKRGNCWQSSLQLQVTTLTFSKVYGLPILPYMTHIKLVFNFKLNYDDTLAVKY